MEVLMTIDWTINISHVLTIACAIAGGIAAWVTLRWRVASIETAIGRIEKAIEAERNAFALSTAAMNGSLKIIQERIEDVRAKGAHELAEFKLDVAKHYAGHAALRDMEARLVKAIDELGERLEKLSEDRQRLRS
jgi:biopolymer transport protein ExbB/TolQ